MTNGTHVDPLKSGELSSAAAAAAGQGFEEREKARLGRKLAKYEAVSRVREEFVRKNWYYTQQVQRLVKSLVVPGSRVLEVGCGLGDLIAGIGASDAIGVDFSTEAITVAKRRHPGVDLRVCDVERDPLPEGKFDVLILSDTLGHLDDVQLAMERLRSVLAPGARVIVTYYNFVWEPILRAAERVGRKTPYPEQNWLSMDDIENLLGLAGYEVFRRGTDVLLPAHVPVVSDILNRVVAKLPAAREFALLDYFVARAVPTTQVEREMSVSVVCPCRNERGHIREAIERTPVMGTGTELIFVDGNSNDGTVEEIEAAMKEYKGPLKLRLIHQGEGKGKGDAVRKGFDAAQNELLMILDADLTTSPEELPKFYRAVARGNAEFVNGVRLVYPMEDEAMRFLNFLGNKFFSLALSWLLEQPIKDSLCGTKVLTKKAYDRIAENRGYFGDFDSFGDFDLLFGAARLNMKIVDMPVRYRARLYGETKMSRFTHGWMLLRMTAYGFRKLRMMA